MAPTPLPTMMATGVARPRAQGQLMTSTLMPRASANVKVWPSSSQMTNVAAAMQMTVGTKMPETRSAVLASGALRRGGVAHQADDLGQRRVLADALGTAGQRTVLVDGRGADGGAGKLVHRHALAGQGGLVDRGDALGDGAVHGDALTGAD